MPETPSASSNPFRRKATAAASGSAAPPPPPADTSGNFGSPSVFTAAASDQPGGPPTTILSSSDYFRSHLETLPQSAQPPPSTSFQKPKVVKRVRVQSPPPSSPESASGPIDAYPPLGGGEGSSSSSSSTSSDDEDVGGIDPFRGAPSPLALSGEQSINVAPPSMPSHRAPPNPFQKTLEDAGQTPRFGNQAENVAAGGKGSLDVQAFRELLLAGLGGAPGAAASGPAANPPASTGDGASITDASSISRQSMFDTARPPESPRISHEVSELGEDDQLGLVSGPLAKSQQSPSTLRKKPRPPSSRHGKLIKVDLNNKKRDVGQPPEGILRSFSPSRTSPDDSSPGTSPSKQRPSTPSDVNKPLPPAPARSSMDGDAESIFDREAAGKVPEPDADLDAAMLPTPRPPTPPNTSHAKSTAASSPQAARKPAPPPRRNPHARTESKASIAPKPNSAATAAISTTAPSGEEPEPARRGSVDSTRSRSSSLRVSIHAPAPPPPRRPNHSSRQSATFVSPSALSFSSIASSSSATSPAVPDAESSYPRHGSIADAIGTNSAISAASNTPVVAPTITASPPPMGVGSSSPGTNNYAPVRLSPPQPPPARNPSVRLPGARLPGAGRPASVSSLEAATSRRIGREKDGGSAPPPPPPPRPKRAKSGGKDGNGTEGPRRTISGDGARALGGPVPEEPTVEAAAAEGEVAVGAGDDILADLDALKREVDAMRGQFEKAGPGSGGAGSSR